MFSDTKNIQFLDLIGRFDGKIYPVDVPGNRPRSFQLPTSQAGTDFDVGEARPPAPHDNVSGRRVMGAGEIAAEPRDLGQIV